MLRQITLISLLCGIASLVEISHTHVAKRKSNVCYDGLGCFTNEAPYFSTYRPISFLPESPSQINPKFTLYTRQGSYTGVGISYFHTAPLKTAAFNAALPTKFIVHGFIDNGGTEWMRDMKNEMLRQGDYNVILVDWGSGSLALYGQASANTRVVGAMIAQLINQITTVTGAKPESMHVIGHSLGAHVAGYAGERLQHLGRITGMDPAEPYFQNTDPVVRLDPTDALFVDVIHSDGASFYSLNFGLGMGTPCGHVDYFPNGGHDQPGCEEGPISHLIHEGLAIGAKEFVACNHLRSYHFFNESINSACPFEGYKCDSEDHFNEGKCIPCSGKGCGFMGFHADQVKPAQGSPNVKYYLKTGSSFPYCRYHYKVTLTFAGSQQYAQQERGTLYLNLQGSNGETHEHKVNNASIYVNPGSSYTYVVTAPKDLGTVNDVVFKWDHDAKLTDVGSWNILGLRHPALYIDKIAVASGEQNHMYNFCEHSVGVEAHHSQIFSKSC